MIRSLVRPVTKVAAIWSSRSTSATSRNAAEASHSTWAAPASTPWSTPMLHQVRARPGRQTASRTTSSKPEPEGPAELRDQAPHREVGSAWVSLGEVRVELVAHGRQRLDPGQQLGGRREVEPPGRRRRRPGPEARGRRAIRALARSVGLRGRPRPGRRCRAARRRA